MLMNLYGTIETERASKSQGGNKFINYIVTVDKTQVARVLVKYDNLIVFDKDDKIIYNELLTSSKAKGKKQKEQIKNKNK